jgi:hypothetical protein
VGLLAAGLATVLILVSGRQIRATSSVSRPEGAGAARVAGILAGLPLVDSSSSASGMGKSLSWSHTINSGADRLLIVGTSNAEGNKTITSVKYGTTSLTRAGFQSGGGNKNRVEIWYLIAPPVGKATIIATVSEGNTKVVGGALGLTGVDQATPVTGFVSAQGQGATATLNVTSAAQQLVVDVLSADGNAGTATPAAGQTVRWNTSTGSGGGDVRGAGSIKPGARRLQADPEGGRRRLESRAGRLARPDHHGGADPFAQRFVSATRRAARWAQSQ